MMRKKLYPALLLAGAITIAWLGRLSAQQKAAAPEFKNYQFALLWAGPNQGGTPQEIELIQRGHMENIGRLVRAGKLAIAGPFDDGQDLRGIFIFNTADRAEAEALVATDPAVKAGRLRPQLLSWWSEKGRSLP